MEKLDLKDCTFGIVIRFTTEDRKRNIKLVIEYLLKHLDTNLTVIEEDVVSCFPDIIPTINGWNDETCSYIFTYSDDEYMNKSKCLNKAYENIKTPIFVLYDADVICSPEMYFKCVEIIRSGEGKICKPFDGNFRNVPEELVKEFSNDLDYTLFTHQNTEYYNYDCPGGALFVGSETFDKCGRENENMKGWGYDDNERLVRYKIMGYKLFRVRGTMYHLNHERTKNSQKTEQTSLNQQEYRRIKRLPREDLLVEISKWKNKRIFT